MRANFLKTVPSFIATRAVRLPGDPVRYHLKAARSIQQALREIFRAKSAIHRLFTVTFHRQRSGRIGASYVGYSDVALSNGPSPRVRAVINP